MGRETRTVSASLAPAAWLVMAALTGQLSANPLADITNETGVWTLRFLCVTLTLTAQASNRLEWCDPVPADAWPLRVLLRIPPSPELRRRQRLAGLDFPVGIVAWEAARDLARATLFDVLKRPFITMGFAAWLCMLLLAITSTAGMIRRLGGRRWQLLHRLTYAAAAAAVLHYWWLVEVGGRAFSNHCHAVLPTR